VKNEKWLGATIQGVFILNVLKVFVEFLIYVCLPGELCKAVLQCGIGDYVHRWHIWMGWKQMQLCDNCHLSGFFICHCWILANNQIMKF